MTVHLSPNGERRMAVACVLMTGSKGVDCVTGAMLSFSRKT